MILVRLIISGCCILFERDYTMVSFELNINWVCFLYECYNMFSTVEIGYLLVFMLYYYVFT